LPPAPLALPPEPLCPACAVAPALLVAPDEPASDPFPPLALAALPPVAAFVPAVPALLVAPASLGPGPPACPVEPLFPGLAALPLAPSSRVEPF
jgi:hypothetical protein